MTAQQQKHSWLSTNGGANDNGAQNVPNMLLIIDIIVEKCRNSTEDAKCVHLINISVNVQQFPTLRDEAVWSAIGHCISCISSVTTYTFELYGV